MADLLAYEKRRLLRGKARRGEPAVVTEAEFEEAWEECWDVMVKDRAWPHLTRERRGWREAQITTKPVLLKMWLGESTPFDIAVDGIRELADSSWAPEGAAAGHVLG